MADIIQVSVTFEDKAQARRASESLVHARLAACAQVSGPITSSYRWKGAIETDEEYLLTIKTRADLYAELESAILELHPYDTPEIIATPVVDGLDAYLDWVREESK